MAKRPPRNAHESKARCLINYRETIANSANDPEGYYRWIAERARDGDRSAAAEMLHGFCDAVEHGTSIPKPITDYLLMTFSTYLSGAASLDVALHLNPPAHRPPNVRTVDPIRAVATLYLYIKRDGLRKGKAKDETAKKLGVSKRGLERMDREYNLIRNFDVADLEQSAHPVAPSRRAVRNSR